MALEILADEDSAVAREPQLVSRAGSTAIAFDNNGAVDNGITILCQGTIQEGFACRRELLTSILAFLEQVGCG